MTVPGFARDVDFVVESGHPASASYSAPRSKLRCRIQREGFLIEPPGRLRYPENTLSPAVAREMVAITSRY